MKRREFLQRSGQAAAGIVATMLLPATPVPVAPVLPPPAQPIILRKFGGTIHISDELMDSQRLMIFQRGLERIQREFEAAEADMVADMLCGRRTP